MQSRKEVIRSLKLEEMHVIGNCGHAFENILNVSFQYNMKLEWIMCVINVCEWKIKELYK